MVMVSVVIALLLLFSCANELVKITSYLKDIRSSASHMQLEVDGMLQRHAAMQDSIDDIQEKLRRIESVASSYEDEVLGPVRRAHAEADFFEDIFKK